jgi:ribosomal protein S18 acetylase RimI-like enzyme
LCPPGSALAAGNQNGATVPAQKFYDLKLGQQLLQHAIDLSTEQGEKGMWLNVWKGNERALRFLSKGRV